MFAGSDVTVNNLIIEGAESIKSGSVILDIHFYDQTDVDSKHKADPNAPRRNGFLDYISENIPECQVKTVFIHPEKPSENMEILKEFFRLNPEIRHIAMTNSRVWLIDEFLAQHPDPQRIVVGFDDLERNLASLRKGHIEHLVTRHIPQQSFKVMTEFAECVIKSTSPARRNNYVHMDILHKRNLDDYKTLQPISRR